MNVVFADISEYYKMELKSVDVRFRQRKIKKVTVNNMKEDGRKALPYQTLKNMCEKYLPDGMEMSTEGIGAIDTAIDNFVKELLVSSAEYANVMRRKRIAPYHIEKALQEMKRR